MDRIVDSIQASQKGLRIIKIIESHAIRKLSNSRGFDHAGNSLSNTYVKIMMVQSSC